MIIGFTGFKGVGKTSAAHFLHDQGFVTMSFAEPIYKIARIMGWDGNKDYKGRRLLQLLGTECGRECIGRNVWVDRLAKIKNNRYPYASVAIDDVRFNNEAEWIIKNKGFICKIVRDGYNGDDHASEQGIDSQYISYVIFNNGDLSGLKDSVLNLIHSMSMM